MTFVVAPRCCNTKEKVVEAMMRMTVVVEIMDQQHQMEEKELDALSVLL
jgi:hypothetical protein